MHSINPFRFNHAVPEVGVAANFSWNATNSIGAGLNVSQEHSKKLC